jgi:3-methylcrotonyl-CoA carboxylase alpha subunit
MGLRTVAVYSEADADALHVAEADEAVLIGPAARGASYLDIGRILDAAMKTGAEAIHPGYGFLSEIAEFAEACEAAGMIFIGPTPEHDARDGLKHRAKALPRKPACRWSPGYHGDAQAAHAWPLRRRKIGYPVLIKASAGGGGIGMQLCRDAAGGGHSFAAVSAKRPPQLRRRPGMLIEKYVRSPPHRGADLRRQPRQCGLAVSSATARCSAATRR